MTVRENGRPVLIYHFESIRDAVAMFDFISDLMPQAQYVIEPVKH